MELTFERLIKFDLIESVEKRFFMSDNTVPLEFIYLVQEINSVDRFIKDSPSFPDSTDKILRNELISAIGATLAIEGTMVDKNEIEESFLKASRSEKLQRKEQEAENSRKVYKFILELVQDTRKNNEEFIYEERIIKQIHKYFTENIDYMSNVPGDYRGDFATTFGDPRRKGICKTRSEIELAMSKLVEWLNKSGKGLLSNNIIVKAIMTHYYLTEIHPFGDGNGRTARALEALILYVYGINNYCFWSLANFWSSNTNEYLAYLGEIYNTSDPWEFLIWGMKGYLDEIQRIKGLVLRKVKRLMFTDYTKYLLASKKKQKIKINQRIVDLLSLLARKGRITFDSFLSLPEVNALLSNISPTTRHRDLKKMRELRLINLVEEDNTLYIETNFHILESVVYNV
jgi:Fic family protein